MVLQMRSDPRTRRTKSRPLRPRVVFITNHLAPYVVPWMQAIRRQDQVRLENWLMTRHERNRNWSVPRDSGLAIRVFHDWGIDMSNRDYVILHFNPGMLWELARHPPDLVILGGYESLTCLSAALVLRRRGIPFVFCVESIDLGSSPTGRWIPWLVKTCFAACSAVIVYGRSSWEHVRSLGVPSNRIFTAPNSVDVNRFHPAGSAEERLQLRRSLGLPDGVLCLYVGQLTERKGIDVLMKGFRLAGEDHPDAHLVLVGGGPLLGALTAAVRDDATLTGRVHVMGPCSEDELPSYYAASDVFVFPTLYDVWGMVLNEAMCSGLPIVSSEGAAGARDLVEEGVTGFRFALGNPEALAAKLEPLLADPELRRRLAAAGRNKILGSFTPDQTARAVIRPVLTVLGAAPTETSGSTSVEGSGSLRTSS